MDIIREADHLTDLTEGCLMGWKTDDIDDELFSLDSRSSSRTCIPTRRRERDEEF
jgi:hypothetical protein